MVCKRAHLQNTYKLVQMCKRIEIVVVMADRENGEPIEKNLFTSSTVVDTVNNLNRRHEIPNFMFMCIVHDAQAQFNIRKIAGSRFISTISTNNNFRILYFPETMGLAASLHFECADWQKSYRIALN